MAYLITHSLLSAWLYSMKENPFADAATEDTSKEDFLRVLRREPTPTTEAMQNGIDFEDFVTKILAVTEVMPYEHIDVDLNWSGITMEPIEKHPWFNAANKIAEIIRQGQLQHVATKRVTLNDMELLLYGRLDALKAGCIYDIKFSKSYDRGKYITSTQHPMYLELVPAAESFTYLISNGADVWTEKYRRDETQSVLPIIRDFLGWLNVTGLMPIYKQYWGEKAA